MRIARRYLLPNPQWQRVRAVTIISLRGCRHGQDNKEHDHGDYQQKDLGTDLKDRSQSAAITTKRIGRDHELPITEEIGLELYQRCGKP